MKYIFVFLVLILAACSSDDNEDASEGCQEYCSVVDANCNGANAIYPNSDACFNACALFTDRPEAEGAQAGDTLQCRTYHVGVASSNPTVHCPHASVASTPDTCQDIQTVCSTYCGEFFETCNTEFVADFGDTLQACLNSCPTKIPKDGTPTDMDTSDTVNCRLSQINNKSCDGGKVESTVCVDPFE